MNPIPDCQIYLSQLIAEETLYSTGHETGTGLELIDFSIGMYLDEKETYIQKWQHLQARYGPLPLTFHGPFLDLNPMSFESYIRKATWQRFDETYDAAMRLGADKIIIHTCRVPQTCYVEGWAERMADFWNDFLTQHPKIPFAIENVFDEDPAPIADFASRVQAPNFSLCLDVGHAHVFSPLPVKQWMETLGPWISHLHLHDNHGQKDEHLAIGAGDLPWEEIWKGLEILPRLTGITMENLSREDFLTSLAHLAKGTSSL